MKKHLPIIVILFLSACAGVALWWNVHSEQVKLEKRERLLEGKKSVMEMAFEAQRVWLEGSAKGVDQNCQDLDRQKYSDTQIRRARQCSVDFLKCWLEQLEGIDKNSVVARSVRHDSIAPLEFGPTGKRALIKLEDTISGYSETFALADSCRDVYLPQGRYAVGPMHPQNNDWQWDNFDRAIFIDRHPVSVRDVKEWLQWADFEGVERPEVSLGEDLLAPSTRLLAEHQELYCASQGASVLAAHYYDAAAFYPPVSKEAQLRIPRGPFPEGRRRQDAYLGLQLMMNETIELDKLCRSFYSQECQSEGAINVYSPLSVSWMGMGHVLGGEFEHLVNPREARRNLKLSSRHYSMMSKWHQIGERGFWDGIGFETSHFNWRTQDPSEQENFYGVTFRCARQGRLYAP